MQKKNFIDTVVPLVVIKRDILKGFVCVCFYSDFFFPIPVLVIQQTPGSY